MSVRGYISGAGSTQGHQHNLRGEARQLTLLFLDIEFDRTMNDVVEALNGNLQNVILGIRHDAGERDPVRLYLASKIQRSNLDFRLGRVETFRDLIEKRRPLGLLQLASHHPVPPCSAQVRSVAAKSVIIVPAQAKPDNKQASAGNTVLGIVGLDSGVALNPFVVLKELGCDTVGQVGRYMIECARFEVPDPHEDFEIGDR